MKVFKLVKNAFTLLRLALLLFPGGWIVIAIGAVVAAGIALYKNWDVVKEKAGQLWSWIKEKWSAIKDWTVEMWGKVKTSIGDAMDNAKQKVSDFFSPLLSFIDDAKARFDKLVGVVKNFKMPSIKFPSLPSWMGGGKEDGSYRTGAYRISEDGHKAILHKGESVLTAGQSNTLRSMGVLQARGNRPVLNTEPLTQTRYKVQKTSAGGVNIDRVNITINGAQKTTKEMTREMVQELKYAISAGGLA